MTAHGPAARRAARAPAHAARPPGWIPYRTVLLQPRRGASAWRRTPLDALAERRLRGLHRLDAGGRAPDLRRVRAARRGRGRGAGLVPRLPPVAGQRQPVGDRGGDGLAPGWRAHASGAYTYRFVFVPGHDRLRSPGWRATPRPRRASRHGLVLTCVGDPGAVHLQAQPPGRAPRSTGPWRTCCPTRRGLQRSRTSRPTATTSASTARRGSTCPSGCLMRSAHGTFPEYHTSADDLDLSAAEYLADTRDKCRPIVRRRSSATARYRNLSPYGEPQLGRRGLYKAIGGEADQKRRADGDALGAQPVRRRAQPAGHRRRARDAVRGRRAGGRRPCRARPARTREAHAPGERGLDPLAPARDLLRAAPRGTRPF